LWWRRGVGVRWSSAGMDAGGVPARRPGFADAGSLSAVADVGEIALGCAWARADDVSKSRRLGALKPAARRCPSRAVTIQVA